MCALIVLIFTSLITNNVQHLSMCLFDFHTHTSTHTLRSDQHFCICWKLFIFFLNLDNSLYFWIQAVYPDVYLNIYFLDFPFMHNLFFNVLILFSEVLNFHESQSINYYLIIIFLFFDLVHKLNCLEVLQLGL